MLHIYSYLLSTKQDEATTTTTAAAAALWDFAVYFVETYSACRGCIIEVKDNSVGVSSLV